MKEREPYQVERDERLEEQRRVGLLKLGAYVMFENEMSLVDKGIQTREQALDKLAKYHADVRAAQEPLHG